MMNLRIKVTLAGALLAIALTFGSDAMLRVHGQTNSIEAFWKKFRSAVIKGDKEAVAKLSRFPITRGYGMASIRTRAQFMRRYRDLFFNETNAALCFPKAKPVIDRERPKEFSVSCPFARDGGNEEPFVYSFSLTRTGWKFTGFENINE